MDKKSRIRGRFGALVMGVLFAQGLTPLCLFGARARSMSAPLRWSKEAQQEVDDRLLKAIFAPSDDECKKRIQRALDYGANVNASHEDGITVLHAACYKGYTAAVQFLLLKKTNIEQASKDGETPLYCAIRARCSKTVDLLLRAGVSVDRPVGERRDTALMLAAEKGFYGIASQLLKYGAAVDQATTNAKTALEGAVHFGKNKTARLLLQNKANPNVVGESEVVPLLLAAKRGHVSCMAALLDYKADVDAYDSSGDTALLVAVYDERKDAVANLLAHGAGVNAINHLGYTPLMGAVIKRNHAIACLLLSHGADVRMEHEQDGSVLMMAVKKNDLAMVTLLLESGANPHAADSTGASVLMVALCGVTNKQIVQTLIFAGASLLEGRGNRPWCECYGGKDEWCIDCYEQGYYLLKEVKVARDGIERQDWLPEDFEISPHYGPVADVIPSAVAQMVYAYATHYTDDEHLTELVRTHIKKNKQKVRMVG